MSRAVATIKDVDEHGPIIEWYQHWAELKGRTLYLAQPAQSVDVEKVREVIESHINEAKKLRHDPESQDYLYEQADKLEAAIRGGA